MPEGRIPEFGSDEEAAEFWDTHSLSDYMEDVEPVENVSFGQVHVEVRLRLLPSEFDRLRRMAVARGTDVRTMLSGWIRERERQEAHAALVPTVPSSTP
jgi:hypothetical protein